SVALGRKLFDAATRIALAPNGRERMIHDLVAASILRRALQSPHTLSADDQSESYLLLGLIALRTTELRPAIPQMEYLLQSAIRSAPHSEFAAKAYRLLEEFGVDAQEGPEDPSLLELPALRELMGADGAARTSVR
ncbi:MAG: hypothetical protein K0U93_15455, partial [Gammaproteobacteria bacterium]|nr:hypothetical protein [Gammaproteobacteria bacterium]